jgi:iron(III) transport system substrate-binding protein
MIQFFRSFPRKRESRVKNWVPAFAGTSGRIGAALALFAALFSASAQSQFGPPELIEAARKEGKLVFYSANVAESEAPIIEAFNKRFPFIKVEFLRAPGNQLLQRVKTEAAAGKLLADVVDHSDRALMLEIDNLFQDYAPPNAADYIPETRASPKLWPRSTVVWTIAYNTELVKNPPKSWADLTKPEYGNKQIGQVIAPSGGTTWTRAMFERQVLGEDYWQKQAATKPLLFPSNAPTSDALVRGEVSIAPLLYNAILPKLRDGAPVKIFFAPEGAPVTPFAAGIPKTAAHPNAARLFMNWCLSEEGQAFMIKSIGNLTSLKKPPLYPEGFDPNVVKVWVPNYEQFVKLQAGWIDEWNKIYGYRQ